jgi:hypothetical protein
MTTIPREELQTIFERLAFPSALQLRKAVVDREKARAARVPRPPDYQPWRITVKDAKAFVAKAGQRQVLAKPVPYDGKIAAGRLDERWAADVISFSAHEAKADEGGPGRQIFIVQDIISREVWTKLMPDNKAATAAAAFREILTESGRRPK